jgi:hypothetical protein
MGCAGGFAELCFHLRRCLLGVASSTLQEDPYFWVTTIKVRPPDGTQYTIVEVNELLKNQRFCVTKRFKVLKF